MDEQDVIDAVMNRIAQPVLRRAEQARAPHGGICLLGGGGCRRAQDHRRATCAGDAGHPPGRARKKATRSGVMTPRTRFAPARASLVGRRSLRADPLAASRAILAEMESALSVDPPYSGPAPFRGLLDLGLILPEVTIPSACRERRGVHHDQRILDRSGSI